MVHILDYDEGSSKQFSTSCSAGSPTFLKLQATFCVLINTYRAGLRDIRTLISA